MIFLHVADEHLLHLWDEWIWGNLSFGVDSDHTNHPDNHTEECAHEEEQWREVDLLVFIQKVSRSIDHINGKLKMREGANNHAQEDKTQECENTNYEPAVDDCCVIVFLLVFRGVLK